MGVQGLWQLLDPLGRPVSLESLENKVLAVDTSIWLHQAVHGFRDKNGSPLPNAHLLGLFNRVCKLLFYGIKPVFVFDGAVPLLKKQTMVSRRARQRNATKEVERTRHQLLSKYLQQKAIQDVLGHKSKNVKDSSSKSSEVASINAVRSPPSSDLYDLPPLSSVSQSSSHLIEESESDSDNNAQEMGSLFQDLDAVNIDSDDFKALPLEIQHEILLEMQDRHKRRSWTRHEALPKNSEEIGNFQIQQLLYRQKIRRRIDTIKKAVNASITGQLISMRDDGFDAHTSGAIVEAKHIASEDSAHYILYKKVQSSGSPAKIKPADTTSVSKNEVVGNHAAVRNGEILIRDERELETKYISDNDSVTEVKVDDVLVRNVEKVSDFTANVSNANSGVRPLINEFQNVSDTMSAPMKPSRHVIVESREMEIDNLVSLELDEGTEVFSEVKALGSVELPSRNQIPPLNQCEVEQRLNSKPLPRDGNSSTISQEHIGKEILIEMEIEKAFQEPPTVKEIPPKDENNREISASGIGFITPANAPEVQQISSDDGDDDDVGDFVEVEVIPERAVEDELFPLEIFQTLPAKDTAELVLLSDSDVEIQVSKAPPSVESFVLPSSSNPEALQLLSEELECETVALLKDKGRQERMAASITDQMYMESQELLKLFGIPFVVSPAEAEAQCAVMDALNLTDGTITDDSDIWLFGANRVYKNFFERSREVLCFCRSDVEKRLHLDRSKLIAIALLTGSDYTDGVKGVGVVTALEILGEFAEKDGVVSLEMFRSWWDVAKQQKVAPSETKVKQKLRGLLLNDGFPNPTVVQAYLEPTVDSSKEKFSWAFPELDTLREFANRKLGWSLDKTNDVLLPIIKRLNAAKERQMRISSYFAPVSRDVQEVKHPSCRLRRALRKVQSNEGKLKSNDEREPIAETSRTDRPVPTPEVESNRRRGRKARGKGRNAQQSSKKTKIMHVDLGLSESSEAEAESDIKGDPLPLKRKRRTVTKKS